MFHVACAQRALAILGCPECGESTPAELDITSYLWTELDTWARDLMLDVHLKGRAVVSNGPRESAELDVFRLHEYGLWATMQQDD